MAQEKRYLLVEGLPLMTTTLWDHPSRSYGGAKQGADDYAGATPSYVIWNLLQRYTEAKDLVVDPMAGSGTTLDVARDLGRRALGYDLAPARKDIFRVDARTLPLEDEKADFVFIDPPYSDHLRYSGRPECIGELDARKGPEYFQAMEQVISEIHRVLRPDRHMALYVGDSAAKGKSFVPIGFELFSILRRYFTPVDIVAVARHNRTLMRDHWHTSAVEGNYFLRGFHYLFILKKEKGATPLRKKKTATRAKAAPKMPAGAGKGRSEGPERKGPGKGPGKGPARKGPGRKAPGKGPARKAPGEGPGRKGPRKGPGKGPGRKPPGRR